VTIESSEGTPLALGLVRRAMGRGRHASYLDTHTNNDIII
jgi:hypothetical protein